MALQPLRGMVCRLPNSLRCKWLNSKWTSIQDHGWISSAAFRYNQSRPLSVLLKLPKQPLQCTSLLGNSNSSSVISQLFHSQHEEDESKVNTEEEKFVNSGWLIRLSAENGYLSWCRNTYIATIGAATMMTQDLVLPYAKEAGTLLLIMGAVNLMCGTGSYLYHLIHLRERVFMSHLALVFHMAMALLHLVLWIIAVVIYLGYVQDDPDPHDPRRI